MKRLFVLFFFVFIASNAYASGKILVVLSSEDKITLQQNVVHETGFFLSELMVPLKAILDAGYEVEFANPKGNRAVLDQISDNPGWFSSEEEYIEIRTLCEELGICGEERVGTKDLRRLSDISDLETMLYDGLFVPGGHAPMEDLLKDKELGRILSLLNILERPMALICHGPIALLSSLQNPHAFVEALAELHDLEVYADERKSDHEKLAAEMKIEGQEVELLRLLLKSNEDKKIVARFNSLLTELHRKYHAFSSNKVLEEQSRDRIAELKEELKTLSKDWPFANYELTSLSTDEEKIAELGGSNSLLGGTVRFYPDEALRYAGANVDVTGKIWDKKVVVDRNLVTGRNVNSDNGVAEEFLKLLKK